MEQKYGQEDENEFAVEPSEVPRENEEVASSEYLRLERVLGFEREREAVVYAPEERQLVFRRGKYIYSVSLTPDKTQN